MMDLDKAAHSAYELGNDKVLFRFGKERSLRLLDIKPLLKMGIDIRDINSFMTIYRFQIKDDRLTDEIFVENSIPVDVEKLIEWIESSAGAKKSYKEVNAEKTETVSK